MFIGFIGIIGIVLLCLTALALNSAAVSIDSIDWVVAQDGESQAAACARNNRNPLFMDFVSLRWNQTTFDIVANDILGRGTSSLVSNSYGIYQCCAPSLWCIDGDGCFTQSFGKRYSNYGWLNNDTAALPVYTCQGDATEADISILKADIDTDAGTLFVLGGNRTSSPSTTLTLNSRAVANPAYATATSIEVSANLGQYTCTDVSLSNCVSCDSNQTCPIGTQCQEIASGTPSSASYCMMVCAGDGDLSCPTGTECAVAVTDDDDSVYIDQDIYLCLPTAEEIFTQECAFAGSDGWRLYCAAQRGMQASNFDFGGNDDFENVTFTVSVRSEDTGFVAQVIEDEADDVDDLADGFCESDSDCFDGNACTSDTCSDDGFCVYATISGCNSIPYSIQSRSAPYMFYSYYRSTSLTGEQQAFVTAMESSGNFSSAGGNDGYPLDSQGLGFTIDYFGNSVSTAYISSYGAVALPPVMPCTLSDTDGSAAGCTLFATQSNAISPFYSKDWVSSNTSIYFMRQSSNDSNSLLGIAGVDAFHVLYNSITNTIDDSSSTFSVSIYSDGSIKISYIDVETAVANEEDNYFGLWGAFTATTSASYLRYHAENIELTQIVDNSEVNYCSFPAIGCIQETCLAAGEEISISWPGGSDAIASGCIAIGEAEFTLECSWAGGLSRTEATINSSTDILSCLVPSDVDFESGSSVTVDIEIGVSSDDFDVNTNDFPGTKTFFGVTRGENSELSRSPLIIKYFSDVSDKTTSSCGCNAMSSMIGTCDNDNVCNGIDDNADCNGDPFGSAVELGCEDCSGGLTGITPDYSCSDEDDNDEDDGGGDGNGGGSSSSSGGSDAISLAIILLMIICCMTFVVVAVSYSLRRMLAIRALNESIAAAEQQLMLQQLQFGAAGGAGEENNANAGLTEFECEALGEVIFSKEFYIKHQTEQARRAEAKADASAAAGGAAAGTCDCAICLCEIEEGSVCRVLPDPCGHVFHLTCIDQWFKQKNSCPMCKRSMRQLLLGDPEQPVTAGSSSVVMSNSNSPPAVPNRFPSQSPSFYNRASDQELFEEEEELRPAGYANDGYDDTGASYNYSRYEASPASAGEYSATFYSPQQPAATGSRSHYNVDNRGYGRRGGYEAVEVNSPSTAGGGQHYFSYVSQQQQGLEMQYQQRNYHQHQRRAPPPGDAYYGGGHHRSYERDQENHARRRTPPPGTSHNSGHRRNNSGTPPAVPPQYPHGRDVENRSQVAVDTVPATTSNAAVDDDEASVLPGNETLFSI